MIKVSVLYANTAGKKFDRNYYAKTHMPMVQQKLGAPCRRIEIDYGLAGGAPGSAPPFFAIVHLYFDSVEAFQAAFSPHAEVILADIPNYTNVEPVIQISELSEMKK